MNDHKPNDALLEEIKQASSIIKIGGAYAHYKNSSKHYKVLNFVVIEEGDELAVLYEQKYGSKLQFVRPVKVWLETVKWQGKLMPRFRKVS